MAWSAGPFGHRITLLIDTKDHASYGLYDEFMNWLGGVILPVFMHEVKYVPFYVIALQ